MGSCSSCCQKCYQRLLKINKHKVAPISDRIPDKKKSSIPTRSLSSFNQDRRSTACERRNTTRLKRLNETRNSSPQSQVFTFERNTSEISCTSTECGTISIQRHSSAECSSLNSGGNSVGLSLAQLTYKIKLKSEAGSMSAHENALELSTTTCSNISEFGTNSIHEYSSTEQCTVYGEDENISEHGQTFSGSISNNLQEKTSLAHGHFREGSTKIGLDDVISEHEHSSSEYSTNSNEDEAHSNSDHNEVIVEQVLSSEYFTNSNEDEAHSNSDDSEAIEEHGHSSSEYSTNSNEDEAHSNSDDNEVIEEHGHSDSDANETMSEHRHSFTEHRHSLIESTTISPEDRTILEQEHSFTESTLNNSIEFEENPDLLSHIMFKAENFRDKIYTPGDDCAICTESFNKFEHRKVRLPCGHILCLKCTITLTKEFNYKEIECPIDRKRHQVRTSRLSKEN